MVVVVEVVEDVAVAKFVEAAKFVEVAEVAVEDTGKWSEALACIINKIKESYARTSWLIIRHN